MYYYYFDFNLNKVSVTAPGQKQQPNSQQKKNEMRVIYSFLYNIKILSGNQSI
jgi:hypothetical protein